MKEETMYRMFRNAFLLLILPISLFVWTSTVVLASSGTDFEQEPATGSEPTDVVPVVLIEIREDGTTHVEYCDDCAPTPIGGTTYTPTVPGTLPPTGPWRVGPSVVDAQAAGTVRTDDGRVEVQAICIDCKVSPTSGPIITPTVGPLTPPTGPRMEDPTVSIDVSGQDGISVFLRQDGMIDLYCGEDCEVAPPTDSLTPTTPFPDTPNGPKREMTTVNLQMAGADLITIAASENILALTGLPPIDCGGTGNANVVARIQIPWSGSLFECETFRDKFQNDKMELESIWEGFGATAEAQASVYAAPHIARSDVSTLTELQGRYSHLLYADSGILAVCAGDDCFEPSPIPPPECYFGCCDWPMQPICSIGAALLYQYATSPDSNVDDSISQSFEQFRLYGEQFMRSSQ